MAASHCKERHDAVRLGGSRQRQQRLTRKFWSLDVGSPALERFVGLLMLQPAVARMRLGRRLRMALPVPRRGLTP